MKLDINKLICNREAKNASWLIGGKIAQMLISLFVGIISARYLGPSNYGLISYGNAMVSFCMAFCTLGLNSIIVKEFFDQPEKEGETLGTAIFFRLLSSIASSILVIAVSFLLDYGQWETIIIVALCSVSLVFHIFDTINYWFQSKYQSKVVAIAGLTGYVITSIYKIVLLMLKKNVFWFAFANSVDYIVLGAVLMVAYRKNSGPALKVSIQRGKQLLQKSYHYILSGMMVAIYGQTDKLMLKHMLNETSVGYYTIATTVCGMWTFVLQAIIDAMNPSIIQSFKKNNEEFERKNKQLYAIVIYVSVSVSVLFMILGKLVIGILYGEAYMPAIVPLKIITWYTAFSYLGVARNAWVVCNDKQKYLKLLYFSAAVINVILNFLLIPVFDVAGAAIASLITQISTSIILPYFIKELRPNAKLMIEALMLKGVN